MKFTRKIKYVYIDEAVLKDEACVSFFIEVSQRKIPILLYLPDIMEMANCKTYEALEYVSDRIYGYTIDMAIRADISKKGITEKNIAIICSHPSAMPNHVEIGEHAAFQNLEAYQCFMKKEIRTIKIGVYTLFTLCMIGLGIFMLNDEEAFLSYETAGILCILSLTGAVFCMMLAFYYRLTKITHMILALFDNAF